MFLHKCQDKSIKNCLILLQLNYKELNRNGGLFMPLSREEHETLLADLLTPELEAAKKTEILQSLRDNYTEYSTTFEVLSNEKEKLAKDNADLVVANSKLFRQTGIVKEDDPKKDEAKEFSKSVTIESLEGR
jgi:phosphopantothenoylcysteine synthetase/decarboxylase